jgi:hypothetical protein
MSDPDYAKMRFVVATVRELQEVLERGGFVGPAAVAADMEAVLAINREGDHAAGFLMAVLADGSWSMDAVVYDRARGVWRDGGSSGVVIVGQPTPWTPPPAGGWGHGPLMGCAFTRQLRFEGEDEYWVSADVGFLGADADHGPLRLRGRWARTPDRSRQPAARLRSRRAISNRRLQPDRQERGRRGRRRVVPT